jgi:hypothetical protein
MSQHTNTRTEPNAGGANAGGAPTPPIVETHPTLKPTLISLGGVVVAGLAVLGYLLFNPTLLGAVERTEIVANLVVILTVIGAGRLGLRLYVLTKTRYVITPNAVRREYSLLYKTFSRELPIAKLRSLELRRSRIEAIFGIGTVAFLSGTIAQSPAYLEFANVPDPDRVRNSVQDRLPSETE